jgi:hypothetical protein
MTFYCYFLLKANVFWWFVGPPGIASRALIERPYYPAVGSSNPSVVAVPTVPGSSGNATSGNGGYAPRTVNSVYSHPASAGSSGSRAVPHEMVIWSCPPGFSAASSTSLRIDQPFPTRNAAPSRHARHVAVGHANNGRNRRARSSQYAFYPSMTETQVGGFCFSVFMKLSQFWYRIWNWSGCYMWSG